MKLNTYHIEVTDTFGGEANYCWKREYMVRAHTMRGAIQVLARKDGAGWIKVYGDNFDNARYDLSGACVCCFVTYTDPRRTHYADVPFIN